MGAAVASAITIGCEHVGGTRWSTRGGSAGKVWTLELATAAPQTVLHLARRDAERTAWVQAAARHQHLSHLEDPPYLEAHRRLLMSSSPLTRKQQGLLRAFAAGSFFRSSVCLCGSRFPTPLQWWSHYAWECPHTAEGRSAAQFP